MPADAELSDLEFAALISSRICHDVISPVGAIANGLEVLAEESDEAMREHAFDLIRQSAAKASAKLQFDRLAFGAAGSQGAQIDLRDAENVTRGILDGDKHRLDWSGPAAMLPKNKVKLLLNMIAIGLYALPRGGSIKVTIAGDDEPASFEVECRGEKAILPASVADLLNSGNGHDLDAHSIQPYYTGRLARDVGMGLEAGAEGESVWLKAIAA
jgi:histidine phosphotransferase ChpT